MYTLCPSTTLCRSGGAGRLANPALPAALAAVPGVEAVGEPVVDEAGEPAQPGKRDQPAGPAASRRHPPQHRRRVRPAMERAGFVADVEMPAHVVERQSLGGERVGDGSHVGEGDTVVAADSGHRTALVVHAGPADRADAGVENLDGEDR